MEYPRIQCVRCGYQERFYRALEQCPRCGGDWLDVIYDYGRVAQVWREELPRRANTMWRYRELLPLRDDANRISLGEGGTPLLRATNLSLMLGTPHLYIKDERQGPTGSFKDRQASLAISVMKELGVTEAVLASTGNVAISYAAYSARAGIKIWAFLTSLVPAEKMREVAIYGAQVIKVTGTYDQTKRIAADFARRRGLYLDRGIRSIAARESMKTVAFEIAEQLAAYLGPSSPSVPWRAPDWYVQAVSGGLGPVGVWKGFEELYRMGLIDRMPRLACIQAEGCAPMVLSFERGLDKAEPILNPRTRIITVATGDPGPAYTFLARVIREHGGAFEMASDEEAFRAIHVLAKLEGLSMEPAAALAFAGLFKLLSKGVIRRDEVVVVNCSGHTFPVEKHLLGEDWFQTIEATRAPAPEEGLLGSLESLGRHAQRIAILEDDPGARRLLRRILQARGHYQIFEAENGRQGLELIRRERPDAILLDLMMPELDGFGVLEALQEDEDLRTIPVIVITAKELTPDERARLSGHIQALLQKGDFTDEELLREISERAGEEIQ
ncbi:MAG: pyridoxal-phosphate dependent enzyme [Anaerolineae bacterium]|nr:pyridoxal-phosphate dependent enzyme [Anaerolineae bacterium]MCX8067336.1 pyridoxal-phosphate dependent enzyme [Anaerolineae bacterium]MDW7992153.1 pyridoxal-phosphate dependent enzyme [Anaerolineae bacterium]